MSHLAWVRARAAQAPADLLGRIEEAFVAHPEWEALSLPEALVRGGEALLEVVLEPSTEAGREVALELLAADACVTWAFEAAADTPDALPAEAEAAMRRVAELVS